MQRWRAFCETIHLLALSIWLAGLVMAGGAAAVLFPTLRDLDPSLPAYASYDGPHWAIAGGHIGQKLFLIADSIGILCVIIAALTLAALVTKLGLARGRWSSVLRGIGFSVAFFAFSWNLFMVSPDMNRSLRAHWDAAQAGDNAAAELHREEFDVSHPRASMLLGITACGVILSLASGLWSVSTPSVIAEERAGSGLERPALSRGGAR